MEKQVSIWIDTEGNVCLAVPGEGEERSVFLTPEEAVLIGNDLVEMGQSRMNLENDQEATAWMRLPMQVLLMKVEPLGEGDPDESLEEAWISCWIRDQSSENATLLAKAHVAEFGWKVLEVTEQRPVSREDYADDQENLYYFDQALIDEIVLVFDAAPPIEE